MTIKPLKILFLSAIMAITMTANVDFSKKELFSQAFAGDTQNSGGKKMKAMSMGPLNMPIVLMGGLRGLGGKLSKAPQG